MLFVSNRDITVRSIRGHSVAFAKGVPTQVPPVMYEEVMEKGILPVDDDGKAVDPVKNEVVQDPPKTVLTPENGETIDADILRVIKDIVKRNNSRDFAGGGHPHADTVSAALQYKVDQKMVSKVWEKHRQAILNPTNKG